MTNGSGEASESLLGKLNAQEADKKAAKLKRTDAETGEVVKTAQTENVEVPVVPAENSEGWLAALRERQRSAAETRATPQAPTERSANYKGSVYAGSGVKPKGTK